MSVMVFGSINMDLTTYVKRLPRPGETLFGKAYLTVPGGKGNNQAVAAARLGAPVKIVGRVGNDGFGSDILKMIESENIDAHLICKDNQSETGLAVISVDESAENNIIVISAANMNIDKSDVLRAVNELDGIKVLMLQLEVPLEASIQLARKAKENNIKVILDPAPAPEEDFDSSIYTSINIITPNERETETLVGFALDTNQDVEKAANILQKKGVETIVIKRGSKGVYLKSASVNAHIPVYKVNAIDSVAAGDAFNGGLAVALSEGKDIIEAVRWGAAAGAIATTRKGALPSMPFRDEVLKILNQ